MREKMSGSWPKQARDTAGKSCHPRAALAENRAFWTQKLQRVALAALQANGMPGKSPGPASSRRRKRRDAQRRQRKRGRERLIMERIIFGIHAPVIADVPAAIRLRIAVQ